MELTKEELQILIQVFNEFSVPIKNAPQFVALANKLQLILSEIDNKPK